MTTTSRIYPGLNCNSVEFFIADDQLKAFSQGRMQNFSDLPFSILLILRDALKAEPETVKILKEWHPESEMKRLETFVKCRFGGLDFEADIKNMELQEGEYWDCPLRGHCKGEGVLCKNPKYNGQEILPKDIFTLRQLATSITNEGLAEKLNLPMGTFHAYKKELYKKFNIQTKPEAVALLAGLNLL